jgi:hypothetical protein
MTWSKWSYMDHRVTAAVGPATALVQSRDVG